MAPSQFPRSLPEMQRMFPDDGACAAYLEEIRWRAGFRCGCGWTGEPYRFAARPHVLRCRQCQRDTSLVAATVMERTRTPLSVWFWAAYLVVTEPRITATGLSARLVQLDRYASAWGMRRALLSSGRREWRGLHSALGIDRETRRGPKPREIAERFWARVQRNGPTPKHRPELGPCWLWTGARDPAGYGRVTVEARVELAHRVAFRIAHHRWPRPCALHHCDNPPCVNPGHLFEGDRPDNTRDMVSKRRGTPRKLGPQQVADILASRARGDTLSSIAQRLNVSQSLISLTARRGG